MRFCTDAGKVVKRWRHAAIAGPFWTWSEQCRERKRVLRFTSKVALRWKNAAVAGPWKVWGGAVSDGRRLVDEEVLRRDVR